MFGDLIAFMERPDQFRATWQDGELFLDRTPSEPRARSGSLHRVPERAAPVLVHAS